MRLHIIKTLFVFSFLALCGSRAHADDSYVTTRLSGVLAVLQSSSLAAPDLSDGNLDYIETFRFDIEDPERSIARQSLSLFLAASNIDQIISHLGIEDDFPKNYLLDYATMFYDNVFLPMNRGDFYVITTSMFEKIRGAPDAVLAFENTEAQIIQGSKFMELFFKGRLYAGAYLRTLAENLLLKQDVGGMPVLEFRGWVNDQWPEIVTETDRGGVDFLGISPILSLYKDTRQSDIEFFWGHRTAQEGRTLLFPLEKNWNYSEETTGTLASYRFFEIRSIPSWLTSMKDIHLGHLCLVAENFDSGKKYAMNFEFPPFSVASIHANEQGLVATNGEPTAPAFTGLLHIRLPTRSNEDWLYHAYYYHDPRYDALIDQQAVEQDALYPFLKPIFYESGECPTQPALGSALRDPSYRVQLDRVTEFLHAEISKKAKPKDKAGTNKKGSIKQGKTKVSVIKFKQRNLKPVVQSIISFPKDGIKSPPT